MRLRISYRHFFAFKPKPLLYYCPLTRAGSTYLSAPHTNSSFSVWDCTTLHPSPNTPMKIHPTLVYFQLSFHSLPPVLPLSLTPSFNSPSILLSPTAFMFTSLPSSTFSQHLFKTLLHHFFTFSYLSEFNERGYPSMVEPGHIIRILTSTCCCIHVSKLE